MEWRSAAGTAHGREETLSENEGTLPRERSDALQHAERISPQVMESLSTPERVETQLGTLEFPLGMPTDETADRVYDHLDRLHAVRGFLDAYSGVSLWAARKGFLEAGIRDNDVLVFSESRGWFVVLRLYSPLRPFFDKSWRPGEIEAGD